MQEKRFGALSSSTNPQELSLTVTSLAQLIISVLVATGVMTATGADTVLEQVPVIVATGYATFQGCLVLWGAVRKVIIAIAEKQ